MTHLTVKLNALNHIVQPSCKNYHDACSAATAAAPVSELLNKLKSIPPMARGCRGAGGELWQSFQGIWRSSVRRRKILIPCRRELSGVAELRTACSKWMNHFAARTRTQPTHSSRRRAARRTHQSPVPARPVSVRTPAFYWSAGPATHALLAAARL